MGTQTRPQVRVLRLVTLGSRRGLYGGPFDTARNQSRLLSQMGFEVSVLAGYRLGDMPEPEEGAFREVYEPISPMWRESFSSMISLRMIVSIIREVRRADIVHVSLARDLIPLFGSLVAILSRKVLVIQPHGMLTGSGSRSKDLLDCIVTRPIVRNSSRVIALTDAEARALRDWSQQRLPPCAAIGNPTIAIGEISPLPSATVREAIFLGRLHPRKRVDTFIEAAARVSGPSNIAFRIVGPNGGSLVAVRAKVHALKEQGCDLLYEGAIPAREVPTRLRRTGVFVLTAADEPWGNVLVLALRLGVPVVVAQSAALAPLVDHFGAGRVVTDGDAAEVAGAITALLNDADVLRRAQEGARRLARMHLSEESIFRKLKDFYREACAPIEN